MPFRFASQISRLRTLAVGCVQRFGARNLRTMLVTLLCMVFWFASQVPRLRTLPVGRAEVRSKEPEDDVGHVVVYGFLVCVTGPQTPNAASWPCGGSEQGT